MWSTGREAGQASAWFGWPPKRGRSTLIALLRRQRLALRRTFEVDERRIDAGHCNSDRLLSFGLAAFGVGDLAHDVVQEALGFFVGKLGHAGRTTI